ncbi:MAG: hypothetical protein HF978_21655 [Desulfobacteraceae bacterium]|nr:hypothetical protein [ANME-2 cluster archaeon]MBC2717915.1 hypothetical protein [Desulfobacteraceae bacterium]MBC2758153.1 hypothetical protein [Desulfobacteraceae bacterium]
MNKLYKIICFFAVVLLLIVLTSKINIFNLISSNDTGLAKKILIEENIFSKKLFYEGELDGITNIFLKDIDNEIGLDLAIFGSKEMHIVNLDSGVKKSELKLQWPTKISRPELIYKKPGSYIIMSRGPVSDVGLIDKNGIPIWNYKPGINVHSMSTADLNNDGEPEYYAATGKGLHQLNSKGILTWKSDRLVYDVEIFNDNAENLQLVATINLSGEMQFRDYYGKRIRKIQFDNQIFNSGFFEFISWTDQNQILSNSGNSFFIFDHQGKLILKHSLENDIFDIRGCAVRFDHNEGPFLAIVAKFSSSTKRSMLCVFNSNGILVYKELIGKSICLLPIPLQTSENEGLLVGEFPNKVYEYSKL